MAGKKRKLRLRVSAVPEHLIAGSFWDQTNSPARPPSADIFDEEELDTLFSSDSPQRLRRPSRHTASSSSLPATGAANVYTIRRLAF
jgi:hypothetical protein